MIETLNAHRCFGGVQSFHQHASQATGTVMRFAVFTPPGAGPHPLLWCLAGLTCNEETFAIKAGAQRAAAQAKLMLITPDTSPRGEGVADDPAWDLGQGAGFYLDATQAPWAPHYRMRSWLEEELPPLVVANFGGDLQRQSITGHSMGGHGALTMALRAPDRFRSVSAFAPIGSPMNCPWGVKAFTAYLGEDRAGWRAYDACALIEDGARVPELLIDQGEADAFLEPQLELPRLEAACERGGIELTLRRHAGYDHGYFFIQSFAHDHIGWHARRLKVE